MTLDLAPEAETILREFAAKEGITPGEYISRLLPTISAPRRAPRLRVLPREEAIALNAPSIARFDRQLAEAANATPEEIAEAQAEWEAFKKAINDVRRENGERLVYAEPDAK